MSFGASFCDRRPLLANAHRAVSRPAEGRETERWPCAFPPLVLCLPARITRRNRTRHPHPWRPQPRFSTSDSELDSELDERKKQNSTSDHWTHIGPERTGTDLIPTGGIATKSRWIRARCKHGVDNHARRDASTMWTITLDYIAMD
jgi:hypothetical protein